MLQNVGSFRGEGRFLTWAAAIAVGVAMTALRRRLWRDLSLEHCRMGGRSRPAPSYRAAAGSTRTWRLSGRRSGR